MNPAPPSRSVTSRFGASQDPQAPGETGQEGTLRSVRLLLRVDGVFEAVLGAFLLLGSATGFARMLALPYPATMPVVIIAGLFLLSLLPILWWISRAPQRWHVTTIAGANGAGALILALWVLIWNGAFTAEAAALVLVVAAVLALLAVLQARGALRAA